jgi:hypothetical protein
MAEATSSVEPGYQESFAAFFVGASAKVEAHYYSIKQVVHKSIPNLARLLGVSQDNFQALLVASGIGSLRKNGHSIFKRNQFDSFLNVHKLQHSTTNMVGSGWRLTVAVVVVSCCC